VTDAAPSLLTLSVTDKLYAARFALSEWRPYFSHAIFGLILVEKKHPGLRTLAADKWWRLYYNSAWVESRSVPDLVVALYAAMSSLLREQFEQAIAYGVTRETEAVARVAFSAEIDDDLRDDISEDVKKLAVQLHTEATLLDEIVYPADFDCEEGALWMHYYEHLLTLPSLPGHSLDAGSGSTGLTQPWEHGSPLDSQFEGLEDGDRRDIQRLVAEAVVHHQNLCGDVPGNWSVWADKVLRPAPIPWDQQLDAAMRAACDTQWGRVLPVYKKPGRRSEALPEFIVPGYVKPRPLIVFVGDTSGSMGDHLTLLRGVVEGLARAMDARIAFISTDAVVHGDPQYIDVDNDVPIEMRGLGGTDMGVGIEWALSHVSPTPNVIVVGTDGATPWPMYDVGVLVIAAIIDNKEADDPPGWIVRIDVKPMKKHLTEN
jgi:hypothetical protein